MRRSGALILLLASLAAGPLAQAAPAAGPRPLLTTIERQVMCVTCKIPLNVAESQQADRERAFIQGLIDQGQSEAQIKRTLVQQYGSSVLGLPAANGFDLAVYLVPLAVVVVLLALVALLLPRWRGRAAGAGDTARAGPRRLDEDDEARLDADLARFD
jgi:cytochrome c-type biogenesis protein CcmH/NrfF